MGFGASARRNVDVRPPGGQGDRIGDTNRSGRLGMANGTAVAPARRVVNPAIVERPVQAGIARTPVGAPADSVVRHPETPATAGKTRPIIRGAQPLMAAR
nr:hypothetical protein [uncultured Rhodopila sp.]